MGIPETGRQQISITDKVDLSQVLAWKNGYFWFDNTSLPDLMKIIERWYDVEINYQGKISEDSGLSGKISRDVPLSSLLKILELNEVKTIVSGNTITVL